jgi:hypothetical protein
MQKREPKAFSACLLFGRVHVMRLYHLQRTQYALSAMMQSPVISRMQLQVWWRLRLIISVLFFLLLFLVATHTPMTTSFFEANICDQHENDIQEERNSMHSG